MTKTKASTTEQDYCCASGSCKNNKNGADFALQHKLTAPSLSSSSGFSQFLRHVKGLYAAALGIEILCIASAEIGENAGLYLFGFNLIGIPISYVMGYALAGFTTFAAIFREKLLAICGRCRTRNIGTAFLQHLYRGFSNLLCQLNNVCLV